MRIFLGLFLLIFIPCMAHAASSTLTTYYPAPNGNYRNMVVGSSSSGQTTAPLIVNGGIYVAEDTGAPSLTTAVQGGYIDWNILDGTGETDFINNPGGGNGGFAFFTVPPAGTPQTERVRIDGNGNVGIGNLMSSPNSILQVQGSGSGFAAFGDGGCGGNYAGIGLNGQPPSGCTNYNILSSPSDQELYINRPSGHGMRFREANVDEMYIAPGGNVGIGITAPTGELEAVNSSGYWSELDNSYLGFYTNGQINATSSLPGNWAGVFENSADIYGVLSNGLIESWSNESSVYSELLSGQNGNWGVVTNANMIADGYIQAGSGVSGTIYSQLLSTQAGTGTLGIYTNGDISAGGTITAASDERLKKNIAPIDHALDKIQRLNGVYFVWKKTGVKDMGVIAQNVEKVFPQIVKTGPGGIKSVEYGNLAGVLIEGIKEQQKEIEAQQEEINNLKKKLGV